MSQLQAVQIDENMVIYIEATEGAMAPTVAASEEGGQRVGKGGGIGQAVETQMAQSCKAIESTIRTYTKFTLNAFKDAALSNVEKVTLEFGVNVSGVGGVPYIAAGTVGCNMKVTVECAFPQRVQPAPQRVQPGVPQRSPIAPSPQPVA